MGYFRACLGYLRIYLDYVGMFGLIEEKLVGAIEAANNILLPKNTWQRQFDPSSDLWVDSARRGMFLFLS